jgi:hypothetical protein
MLDFLRYRIQAPARGGPAGPATIWRPDTGEQVGSVAESPPRGLRRLFPRSWQGRQLGVREFPEPALVFRIDWPAGIWQPNASVYDAMEERMGYFSRAPRTRGDGFEIYLSRLVRLAVVSGSRFDADFLFTTPKGQALAQVSRPQGQAINEWLIIMDDCLEHEPIVKMLLLAAVLMFAYDVAGSEARLVSR